MAIQQGPSDEKTSKTIMDCLNEMDLATPNAIFAKIKLPFEI